MATTLTDPTLPPRLAAYVPKGHRLFFATNRGADRKDWLLCDCGIGLKLEKLPDDEGTEPVTDEHWLQAINQCRLAVHSARVPCLPITMDGETLPIRERPPEQTAIPVTPTTPERVDRSDVPTELTSTQEALDAPTKRRAGRPRGQSAGKTAPSES